MRRGAALLQTSPHIFVRFLAPGNPGREWERLLVLHIHFIALFDKVRPAKKKCIEHRTQIGVKLKATNKAVQLSSIATQIEPSRVA